jgi:hypothetical protein
MVFLYVPSESLDTCENSLSTFALLHNITVYLLVYNSDVSLLILTAGILQWVYRLAICSTALDSNPGGSRDFLFSKSVQTGTGAQAPSCTMNTAVLTRE